MSATPGSMFLPKPKSGATSVDADGKVVKVEVREDEEQGIKLQEIIELLVAAGYFRARIKGLTPFDKVVGGLVWCIENCNVDVDVDLLFQENLTIGQRISLTEKIVRVLPAMGCPHSIEPHQIQGLDCIHVFPVIQWLVKRSLETRQEMGAQIRALAVSQFARLFPKLQQQQNKQQSANSAAVMQVMEAYAPVRKYRRRGAAPSDERSRVQSTLLEYGHMRPLHVSEASGDTSPDDQNQEVAQGANKQEEKKLAALMQDMDIAHQSEGSRIAANIVGNIVSLRAGEIAQAAELYAEKSEELANQASPGGEGHSLARQAAVLTRRKENLEAEVAKLVQQESQYQADIEASQKRISDAKVSQEELQQNLGMLSDIQGTANKGIVRQLHTLVVLHDNLASQEAEFKQHCRTERNRLQALVAGAGEAPVAQDSLAPQLEKDKEQLGKIRMQLGRKNRAIAGLQRQLDEVPGRAELAQYQRRFLELYTQVSAKHKETKQYYTFYNTLHDTQLYLNKELTLLNSIQDNYARAMSSSSGREEFLTQFEAIVKGIKDNKSKVEARRDEERARRDRLSQTLLSLVEQQRSYVAAVTQLTAECRHNEALLAQLRAISEPSRQ